MSRLSAIVHPACVLRSCYLKFLGCDILIENDYCTLPEAADKLGVDKTTLRRWVKLGIFPAVCISGSNYLIKKSDAEDPVLSLTDVARYVGVTRRTIRKCVHDGKLRAADVGGGHYIRKSELTRALRLMVVDES